MSFPVDYRAPEEDQDEIGGGRYVIGFLLAALPGLGIMYWQRKNGWRGVWICAALFVLTLGALIYTGGFDQHQTTFPQQGGFQFDPNTTEFQDIFNSIYGSDLDNDQYDYTDADVAEAEALYGPISPLEQIYIDLWLSTPGNFYVEARCIWAAEMEYYGSEEAYEAALMIDPFPAPAPGSVACYQFE